MKNHEMIDILFVDDDNNVLEGLKRSLRNMRSKWNMVFASSGAEAMDHADRRSFQILVSDLCMPGMSGQEVLVRFRELHPEAVRIVLSGQTDRDVFWKSIGLAHSYFSKPCDGRILSTAISRIIESRKYLKPESIRRFVSKIEFIPFHPDNWRVFQAEAEAKVPSVETLTAVVRRDMGMLAKVLQIANSVNPIQSHWTQDPKEALSEFKMEGITAMAEAYNAFSQSSAVKPPFDLIALFSIRCLFMALVAQRIAQELHNDKDREEKAFITGLLNGIGNIILACRHPEDYNKAIGKSQREKIPFWQVERELFGCTHGEVAAYLLGLWGFPSEISGAMAFQHNPPNTDLIDRRLITEVHVAGYLADQLEIRPIDRTFCDADLVYLDEIGLADHLPAWQNMGVTVYEKLKSDNKKMCISPQAQNPFN